MTSKAAAVLCKRNGRMMNHTPGPWELGSLGSVVTRTPDDQVRITGIYAEETIRAYGGHVICETVMPANAKLIAAAPELLEALEWLVNIGYDVGKDGGRPKYGEFEDAILSAQRAIAKATGGDDDE